VSSSFSSTSQSLSNRVTNIEGNYATTGSNVFMGAQTVCANITSTGTIVAQTLNVQQVTSSIVYSCGSNIFGCSTSDVQQMTGSVRITGSLNTIGNACVTSICSPSIIGGTISGTTVYASTVVCSPSVLSSGTICSTGNTCFGGMSIIAGCVGIGTTSPNGTGWDESSTILHIYKNTTSGGLLKLESSNTTAILNAGNDQLAIFTTTDDPIRFGTNGSERMRITSTGIACFACQVCAPHFIGLNNISIGSGCTTSDGYNTRLRITCIANDTFVFSFNNQACKPIMYMYGGNTNNPQGYTAWVDNTSGNTNHQISHITTESTYFAGQGGKVGIGITTPCSTLHVATGPITDGIFLSRIAACTNKQAILLSADSSVGAYIAGGTNPDGTATQTDGFGRLILQGASTEGFQFQTSAVAAGAAQSWNTRARIFNNGIACFACQVCAPMASISGCIGIGTNPATYTLKAGGRGYFFATNQDAGWGMLTLDYGNGTNGSIYAIQMAEGGAINAALGFGSYGSSNCGDLVMWTNDGGGLVERSRMYSNGAARIATMGSNNTTILQKSFSVGPGACVNVCFDIFNDIPGKGSGYVFQADMHVGGYGSAGSSGLLYKASVAGFDGHHVGIGSYHKDAELVKCASGVDIKIYNPAGCSCLLGITIYNCSGTYPHTGTFRMVLSY